MENKLKQILELALEESICDYELNFKDYDNWDSLVGMVIIDKIDSEFDIVLKVEDLEELNFRSLITKLK